VEKTHTACPLCGNEKRMRKRTREIYGRTVCKRCADRFVGRRQLAYVLDFLAFYLFSGVLGAIAGAVLVARDPDVSTEALEATGMLVGYGAVPLFLFRDSWAGRSIGKILLGLQTVDDRTGAPIGVSASIRRTLPLLIPFVPLIVAFQLYRSRRWGDGWARSRVVWKRYGDSPVFAPEGAIREVFS